MKYSMSTQPVSLLKLMLILFCANTTQGRELCWHDFKKYMFDMVMCQDTCEPISFELGMMLNTTDLYSLIPVWMTLMVTQGHRVAGKLEIVQSFWCKASIHEAVVLVD